MKPCFSVARALFLELIFFEKKTFFSFKFSLSLEGCWGLIPRYHSHTNTLKCMNKGVIIVSFLPLEFWFFQFRFWKWNTRISNPFSCHGIKVLWHHSMIAVNFFLYIFNVQSHFFLSQNVCFFALWFHCVKIKHNETKHFSNAKKMLVCICTYFGMFAFFHSKKPHSLHSACHRQLFSCFGMTKANNKKKIKNIGFHSPKSGFLCHAFIKS